MTAGTLAAGWITDRLPSRRTPLIATGLVCVPLAWLAGRVTNLVGLTAATAGMWFLGGINLVLINIIAGLSAGKGERGRVFGVLALASPLGALVGGLASGPIVDQWDFRGLFSMIALTLVFLPAVALLVKDTAGGQAKNEPVPDVNSRSSLGTAFTLLFTASLAMMIANFVGLMGRSLLMTEQRFSAAAISSTGAIGALVTLPLPYLFGALSDRFNRRILLASGYLVAAVSLALLGISSSLWQFWIASSLGSIQIAMQTSVGPALVADIVSRDRLGGGMAGFNATTWLGGVIGFALTGLLTQGLGYAPTFFLAAALPLGAILVLTLIKSAKTI